MSVTYNSHIDRERTLLSFIDPRTLEWSQHAMGFASAWLNEHIRIHVWDSRFHNPDPHICMIHSHNRGMISNVICGRITNTVYHSPMIIRTGSFTCYDYIDNKPVLKHQNVSLNNKFIEEIYSSHTYELRRDIFHETLAEDGTITLCEFTNFYGYSRVLAPNGVLPLNGRVATILTDGETMDVIQEAWDRIHRPRA